MFKGISEIPRTMTAIDASKIITNMTLDIPVKEWAKTLGDLDIESHYERTFAAMWALAFTLVLPTFVTDYILPIMAKQFIMNKKNCEFFINTYLPEVRNIT